MAKPEKTTEEELVRLVEERITGSLGYGRGERTISADAELTFFQLIY